MKYFELSFGILFLFIFLCNNEETQIFCCCFRHINQASLPLRDDSMSEEATYNQFDGKVLGALQAHSYSDLVAPIGSPFAADFGYERNGLNFQDGTSEPDASLSELLEGLENHGSCFYEESTGHKAYDPSGSFISSNIDDPTQAPLAICKVRLLHGTQALFIFIFFSKYVPLFFLKAKCFINVCFIFFCT